MQMAVTTDMTRSSSLREKNKPVSFARNRKRKVGDCMIAIATTAKKKRELFGFITTNRAE